MIFFNKGSKEVKPCKEKASKGICQVCGDRMNWVGTNTSFDNLRFYMCSGECKISYNVDISNGIQTKHRMYPDNS